MKQLKKKQNINSRTNNLLQVEKYNYYPESDHRNSSQANGDDANDFEDDVALAALVGGLEFEFPWIDGELHTVVDGEDLSVEIRTPQGAMDASTVSKVGAVREALVALQRQMGAEGGVGRRGRVGAGVGAAVGTDVEATPTDDYDSGDDGDPSSGVKDRDITPMQIRAC